MIDISKTIAAKSDQMNADDLMDGTKTITITDVTVANTPEQPITIRYEGDEGKPFKPCKSMRRLMVRIWGKDGKTYIGRSLTLYRDDTVKFAGKAVGGLRIKYMSDIEGTMTISLAESKRSKKPFTVEPLPTKEWLISQAAKQDDLSAWAQSLPEHIKAMARKFWSEIKQSKEK